ncbi:MAG: putative hydrolase of HD superfamily [Planctomycetota bacterium]|jgi:putative hydrolase of HD superfamily
MNQLDSLLALAALDRLPRTGWLQHGVQPCESIAGHIVGVAHLCLLLGPAEQATLDLSRLMSMALLHDAPEARTGDLPRPASRHLPAGAKRQMEAGVAGELLAPFSESVLESWKEYDEGQTAEAHFVRICDRLQLGLCLLGYLRSGYKDLRDFQHGLMELDCSEFPGLQRLHVELMASIADAFGDDAATD